MHETFMRRALEIARESINEPGALPYAAVIAKDGKIIGEGLNRALGLSDPTSHGEVEAIRDACRKLGTTSLAGADLYTTAEPCAMCVATMYLAGIAHLYYASTAATSSAFMARLATKDPRIVRRFTPAELRHEVSQPMDQRQMPATPLLEAEMRTLFDDFAKRAGA